MSDRHSIISEQSQFYRNNFRKLLNLAFILFFIVMCLIAYIIYVDYNKPVKEYFATTSSGQVVKIIPTESP